MPDVEGEEEVGRKKQKTLKTSFNVSQILRNKLKN